jgi:hypothetical protein
MSKEVKEFRDKCNAFIRNVNFQYNQHLILKNISNDKNYLETNYRLSNSIWIESDFICEEFNNLIEFIDTNAIINTNHNILIDLLIEFSSMCYKLVYIFREIDDNVLTEKILRKFKILHTKDKLNNLFNKSKNKKYVTLTGMVKLIIYLNNKIKENEK